MVKIFLDKELNYKDWSMFTNSSGELMLSVIYPSNKKFTCSYKEFKVEPTIIREERVIYDKKKKLIKQVESIVEVGKKYFIVKYSSSSKEYLLKYDQVEVGRISPAIAGNMFGYFKKIAQDRLHNAKNEKDRKIAQNIVSQFDKIVPFEETALHAYMAKKLQERNKQDELIYPFGINETQMEAVENAFSSQLSVIEGPPGTGKTQTILNIIANIIVNGKTCAIVSNNNSAVENVYEKLGKKQLGFLIAKLGNNENKEKFFHSINYNKPDKFIDSANLEEIRDICNKLEKYLSSKNKLAKLACEIQEIEIEKNYLKQWREKHPEIKVDYIKRYNLNCIKTVDLMTYLMYLADRALTFKDKWELLLRYKIFRSKFLNDVQDRESFIFSLQVTYYDKLLKEKYEEKAGLEQMLMDVNFDDELERLQDKSLKYFYQYIAQNMHDDIPEFTDKNYREKFAKFTTYFPVIGSSTHSLVSSIPKGYLLDYVIIDEASQQDLVPGILCFGCARNVIVVGDRKQLSHIATTSSIVSPDPLYDCMKYSLLDSICEVFQNDIPRTLLKEHYRCHPKIIQFCNKQFYDNQLIPMTEDKGEDALSLIITALGNHMRNNKNKREIESVLKVTENCGFLEEALEGKSIGFIAPYNNQVDLANNMMPASIVKNTIHKFQGRECDEIIFSTVLDKKAYSQRQLNFVDNAQLVNVAVSRAKNKFTIVTGNNVFAKNDKYIAALIRYIQYYAPEENVHNSPVISAFDLLYAEYDKSLERLEARLNPNDSKFKSEQIMAAILREVLSTEEFNSLMFHKQIYLKQLVLSNSEIFTDREIQYINHRASCDFVIYYRIGKKPFAVIEVDGGYHDTEKQIERDMLKDSIVKKAGMHIHRFRTTDSNIKEGVTSFIRESQRP